jgi:predicted enzyme related to lactoylglutathione lyase
MCDRVSRRTVGGMTEFAAPPPDLELQRLEPLLGTWTVEGQTLDSVLGPGVPVTSTETFQWLEGGYFLVSSYETVFGDEPAQRGVNYWGYDSAAERFRIVFFSNNGPFTEEGNRYQGELIDGELIFEGPARFRYEVDDEGAIRVNPDGTISVAWWLRDQNGDWQPWMNNTYAEAGGGSAVIKGVSKVVLAVDDQQQAREFWTTRMGFSVTQDEAYGNERWVEVAPPNGGPVLVLSPRAPGQPRPEVPDMLPHSPVFFTCDDIQRTHRELTKRGVEFTLPPAEMHFGWWALFSDQEGTRYALGQWE